MKRADTAMARRIDDDLIILDVASGKYFELNDVGGVVWDRLDGAADLETLVDAVLAEFDADRDEVSGDVEALLAELVAAGLVVTDP